MKVPGAIAKHAIITDACREGRGDLGAFDEAVARLRLEYEQCLTGWPQGQGAAFHVVLTVAKAEPSEGA